jgi:regulator of RNase E activity RraA
MMDIQATFGPHRGILFTGVLADVLDSLGHRTGVLPAEVRPLKPEWKIFGRAATLEMVAVSAIPEKPYAVELACIDGLKSGEVLVAATHGDRKSALWGELLSTACRARGAVGVVIDGLTRDAARIFEMDYPVFAAGYTPLDSKGRLDGVNHTQPIQIGDCTIRPGDWVFGDIDGVVVVPAEMAERVFPLALEKVSGENRVRDELAKGRSVGEVFAEYGIL